MKIDYVCPKCGYEQFYEPRKDKNFRTKKSRVTRCRQCRKQIIITGLNNKILVKVILK